MGYLRPGTALLNAIAIITRTSDPMATAVANDRNEEMLVTAAEAINAVAPAGG